MLNGRFFTCMPLMMALKDMEHYRPDGSVETGSVAHAGLGWGGIAIKGNYVFAGALLQQKSLYLMFLIKRTRPSSQVWH